MVRLRHGRAEAAGDDVAELRLRADGTLSAIVKDYGFTDRNLWSFPTAQ
jgi:hypothetical protein